MNMVDINPYGNGLLYIGFNQEQDCFACGIDGGFRIYSSDRLTESGRHYFPEGGLCYVEMLSRSNYLALVGGGIRPLYSPNKVIIWDDIKKEAAICLDFNHPVKAVRLSREHIVVVLKDVVQVFTFEKLPQKLFEFETKANPKGLCVMCSQSKKTLLAFPGTRTGHVQVFDLANTERAPLSVVAHETAISCIAFNLEGTRLATASGRGTLIRIFDTGDGRKVFELRRGSNQANIFSINFNQQSTMLVASSDHGTVHVFHLDEKKSTEATFSILPKYFSSQWSFVKFSIPQDQACVCAFGANPHSIIAVCVDGNYYKYNFNRKGDFNRDITVKFLEITDDKGF